MPGLFVVLCVCLLIGFIHTARACKRLHTIVAGGPSARGRGAQTRTSLSNCNSSMYTTIFRRAMWREAMHIGHRGKTQRLACVVLRVRCCSAHMSRAGACDI